MPCAQFLYHGKECPITKYFAPFSEQIAIVNILFGIGNTLRWDDGAGPYIAHHLQCSSFLSIDCGTVPENFTSVVRKIRPELLLFIDAADMGLSSGEFRIIHKDNIKDVSIGTHQLPLSYLIDFLSDSCEKILFIGIQPGTIADGESLSDEVLAGSHALIRIIEKREFERIQPFAPGTEAST
jgi:hydrogenase 3 maturation protease